MISSTHHWVRRGLALLVAMVLMLQLLPVAASAQITANRTYRPSPSSLAEAESLSQAFNQAAKAILPAVVKIRTTTTNRVMIRGFFPIQAPDQEGLGSGVIIRSDGTILTNNHVVKDADSVIVELQDGTELYATEYVTDPMTDLAIVKVKSPEPLPYARLGSSEQLSIGDWVLAVGHPLELETSVSAGIISAKGRSLGKKIPRAQFLQTDAAINPGNSGGPLVNLRGEVVGINTAIASQTGGYQGIGFAVPADLAQDVVKQLLEKGTVTRGYLGVSIQDLTKDLSQQLLRQNTGAGVLVNAVRKGTPAEQAGIRPGDVITRFANYPVDSPSSLQRAVERVGVGTKQPMEIVRFGKPLSVAVSTLQFNREQLQQYQSVTKRLSIPVVDNSSLGFEVANLAELAARQGLRIEGNAVVISRVGRKSLAETEDLRPGMIIKQVRNQAVSSVDEFYAALRTESLADGILMLIEDTREDSAGDRFVVIRAIQ